MMKLRHYLHAFALLCAISLGSRAYAQCPCTLWSASTMPVTVDGGDPTSVEVGVVISASVNGFITGVRFYKSAANTGTHIGDVWTSTGTLLGSATFTGESASGWQQVNFSVPVLISANTPYIVSYYAPNGHYSADAGYFAQTYSNPPLQALQDGLDGPDGNYSVFHAFPVNGYESSNYWVDAVFVPENTTSTPGILSVLPANSSSGVGVLSPVEVVFDQAMTAATVNGTTFELLNSSNQPVSGSVAYNPATQVATFTPAVPLSVNTAYTAIVQGGASGVLDSNGNALARNFTWTFTTQVPPASSGPGGPILVISNVSNPFTQYFSEILSTEGFNEYTVTDISLVTATTLANYDVVILGDMQLSESQAAMLSTWAQDGGNLIAMHPDPQLAGLLGLVSLSSTLPDGYILVQTSTGPGVGIVGETMQFHGRADLYSLNGASAIATLYSDSTTPTGSPAVTVNQTGGGQAAAFTYDLARSVVYTRQGNPAWAGEARDGQSGPIRSDDLFFGDASFDPEPDWVNLNNVAIPQADEQQRLLANLILQMEAARKPLPRFWYFPSGFKAVVVMTGDDHGSYYGGGVTTQRFNDFIAASPTGCSVPDWQCVRATSNLFPSLIASNTLTNAQAAAYVAQGFEISAHVDSYLEPNNAFSPTCSNFTAQSLSVFYSNYLASFASEYPSLPAPMTHRMHCVSWSTYDDQPQVELNNGMRLDTTYYYWPASWINNVPGMFTGSGMPMRFTDLYGNIINVYQAVTQMTDESSQTYPFTVDTLLDNAVEGTGYYGAFVANMHNDEIDYPGPGANQIVAAAQALGVPVVSAVQLLTWLDGRNSSSFNSLSWSGSSLSFGITVGTGARNLQAMIPAQSVGGTLTGIAWNGNAINYTIQTIKGVNYAFFAANAGSYQASYSPEAAASLTPSSVLFGNQQLGTISGQTVQLSNIGTAPMTINSISLGGTNPGDFVETNNCGSSLAAGANCTINVDFAPLTTGSLSATLVVNDNVSANPQTTAALSGTGITGVSSANCPCSIWNTSTTPGTVDSGDPSAVEVGVTFESSLAGFINSVLFYKSAANTGTHIAHLWTISGTLLASATFTGESASGWQQVNFSSPVAIAANTPYVASYVDPNGHYSFDAEYFENSYNNPPLQALQDGAAGPNGNYVYGTGFPTLGYEASNYWIDVVFSSAAANGVLTTPAPGTVLSGSTVTFDWAAGSGATAYWLDVGNVPGGNQYHQSGNLGNVLTTTVSGLPTNGSTVYATLYSLINGQWVNNEYVYLAFNSAAASGVLTTPTPGSTLNGSTVTFNWTAGSSATAYWLDVGSVPGGNQYYQSGNLGSALTTKVSGLPTNGSTIYVTLYSQINGAWVSNPYTYTAFNPLSGAAVMQTPTPESTLTGSSVTFTWSAGSGVSAYWLDIGNVAGGNQYYQSGAITAQMVTVNSLPTDGSTVYVTLYSQINGAWVNNPYTYTAFNPLSGAAVMQTPTPGSTLTGSSVTFTWSAGSGPTAYWLDMGTSPGGNQYYQSGPLTAQMATVNSLPTNGSLVYATLYSLIDGSWVSNSYTYTDFNPPSPAVMQTPTPGSTLTANATTFTWSAGSGATAYWLDLGTSAGGNNIYQSGSIAALTTTAPNVQATGQTFYATLYSLIGGSWVSNSYTYTAAPGGVMGSPTPGSTLSGSSVTFTWSAGTGATAYWLTVGSTYGGSDIYSSANNLTVLSTTATNLPANGSTIYVTLYSFLGGQWVQNYYSYVSGP